MLGQAQETLALAWGSLAMPIMEHQESHNSEEGQDIHFDGLTKRQAYCLFISHILSMSNSRMYEFGAVRVLQCFFRVRWAVLSDEINNELDFIHPGLLPRESHSFVNQVSTILPQHSEFAGI